MNRRRLAREEPHAGGAPQKMNRLYAVESSPGLSGAVADHRLALRADRIEGLAAVTGRHGLNVGGGRIDTVDDVPAAWLTRAGVGPDCPQGREPGDRRGRPTGRRPRAGPCHQPFAWNVGKTVEYMTRRSRSRSTNTRRCANWSTSMRKEEVELLVVLGGNPVYNAPGELEFGKHYEQVKLRVHLSDVRRRNFFVSHWHIPAAHYLESWGDACAFDGTATSSSR